MRQKIIRVLSQRNYLIEMESESREVLCGSYCKERVTSYCCKLSPKSIGIDRKVNSQENPFLLHFRVSFEPVKPLDHSCRYLTHYHAINLEAKTALSSGTPCDVMSHVMENLRRICGLLDHSMSMKSQRWVIDTSYVMTARSGDVTTHSCSS